MSSFVEAEIGSPTTISPDFGKLIHFAFPVVLHGPERWMEILRFRPKMFSPPILVAKLDSSGKLGDH